MLWKKPWRPDAVLLLVGAVAMFIFSSSIAIELLARRHVAGFESDNTAGKVLAGTLCLQGVVILAGAIFLKLHNITWREALALNNNWRLQLLLALTVLAAALPVMFGLQALSILVLQKMHWVVEEQRAVEMFTSIGDGWLRYYLMFFAVVLAPMAEEFVFRGFLYSAAKKMGWPIFGWVGVSLLFALIHYNAPIFLPLFVLALALTWLYEKTEGLFAPILVHSLFNAINLVLLVHKQHAAQIHS